MTKPYQLPTENDSRDALTIELERVLDRVRYYDETYSRADLIRLLESSISVQAQVVSQLQNEATDDEYEAEMRGFAEGKQCMFDICESMLNADDTVTAEAINKALYEAL